MLSRPSEPRSRLCFKEAQVLPEEGGKWAKASRKSGRAGCGEGKGGREGEEFSEEVLLSRHKKSSAVLCRGKREFCVLTVGPGCTSRRQATGSPIFVS